MGLSVMLEGPTTEVYLYKQDPNPKHTQYKRKALDVIKHYTMKAYGGLVMQIHNFLTWVLVGGELSVSRPCRFTPGERDSGINWTEDWVGPRTSMGDEEKRKSCLYRDSNSDPSVVQSVASLYTESQPHKILTS
jgi:hypothetical protein